MKIFLDANMLVSILNKEYPLFTYAARVLSLADNPKFQLCTSPVCLAIAFYFSEKKSGRTLAKNKIGLLVSKIKIAEIDNDVVMKSLKDKAVDDFEDGIEYYAAIKEKCKCIITEDVKDFQFSKITVMNARQFLEGHVKNQNER